MRNFTRSRMAIFGMLAGMLAVASCGGSNDSNQLPSDFQTLSLDKKMNYMMSSVTPDSVARFIYTASLGKIPGVDLDLNQAVEYASVNYKGKDLDEFFKEYQVYRDQLPLKDLMNFYYQEGMVDSLKVGMTLGLGYLATVRENGKTVKAAKEEILEFKKACKGDTAMYRDFLIGLRYALDHDRGKDLDDKIYNELINLDSQIQ